MSKLVIMGRVLPDGGVFKAVGRNAWALQNLLQAGEQGCTPIDHPGPRWAHYVLRLRRMGLVIETIDEKHGGPFPGSHARYVLRTQVELFPEGEA